MTISSTSIALADLERGVEAFAIKEPRDAMYRVATKLIDASWGSHEDVADALGVLLLTWNQAFYRYGSLNFERIQEVVSDRAGAIEGFRQSELVSMEGIELGDIEAIYEAMLEACSITTRQSGERRRSPVSAAKALHMLAPTVFPLWDDKIARALGVRNGWPGRASARYCEMLAWSQDLWKNVSADSLTPLETLNRASRFDKPPLKYIDEYLYARFTKKWI